MGQSRVWEFLGTSKSLKDSWLMDVHSPSIPQSYGQNRSCPLAPSPYVKAGVSPAQMKHWAQSWFKDETMLNNGELTLETW